MIRQRPLPVLFPDWEVCVRRLIVLAVLLLVCFTLTGCAYYHKVQPGDTWYKLSKDYGVSVQEIQRANPGVDPYSLQIGQGIKIPRFPDQRVANYTKKTEPKARVAPTPQPRITIRPQPTPNPSAKKPGRSSAVVTNSQPRFVWPVQGGAVKTHFGTVIDGAPTHGIEIGAARGTPVVAAADGKVILSSSEFKGYGNMVVLRHDNNFFTIYSYNQRNFVKKGQQITQGQKIAEVGQSGRATESALHFQIRIGAKAVDPLMYLPRR